MFSFFQRLRGNQQRRQTARTDQDASAIRPDETGERKRDPEMIHPNVSLVEVVPRDETQPLRGSKRRFSEVLDYNLSLMATRLPEANLIFEEYRIGSLAKRRVVIAYIEGICHPGILDEVRDRILAVRTTTILDSSYIERNIENSHLSPFPQIENTSRPEIAESALLQGRVGIFIDESPEALLAPTTFFDLMDTPEDAAGRWFIATTFFRFARYIMFFLAACLPAFYIALTSFNIEFLPTELAFYIAANKGGAPFPVYFEAFMMMGVVEAVRLVLLRLPSQLGTAIAVFSGLTLVGAGLLANIFGATIVMIVTLTIITSFGIPSFDLRSAVRMIQFFTMIMASLFGIFGFAVAFFYLGIHMTNLKSFGVPYMAPLAPIEGSGWPHTILRKAQTNLPEDETYQTVGKEKGRDE